MRTLLVLCLMALSASAFAQSENFVMPDGSNSMQLIQGQLTNVQLNHAACPARSPACEDFTTATLAFALNGCVDSLGPVTVQKSFAADGKLDLYVTAFNIANPLSTRVRCYATPIKVLLLTLGRGAITKEQIRIHFAQSIETAN